MPLSPSGSGSRDFTGWDNQQTPEWTFNLNDNLEFRSTLDANFKDNRFVADTLDRRHEQPATTIFSMGIERGYMALGHDWQ